MWTGKPWNRCCFLWLAKRDEPCFGGFGKSLPGDDRFMERRHHLLVAAGFQAFAAIKLLKTSCQQEEAMVVFIEH